MTPPITRGTIVLVPFPFTDLSDVKIRPAVVVSRSQRSDGDVLVAFIGTQRGQTPDKNCLPIDAAHPHFARTGLQAPSLVRADKIMTLDCHDLIGKLGDLPEDFLEQLDVALRHALEL